MCTNMSGSRSRIVSNTGWLLTRSGASSVPATPGNSGDDPAHAAAAMVKLAGCPRGGWVRNRPVTLVSSTPLSSTCHQYRVDGASPLIETLATPWASTACESVNTGLDICGSEDTATRTGPPPSTLTTNVAPSGVVAPTIMDTTA